MRKSSFLGSFALVITCLISGKSLMAHASVPEAVTLTNDAGYNIIVDIKEDAQEKVNDSDIWDIVKDLDFDTTVTIYNVSESETPISPVPRAVTTDKRVSCFNCLKKDDFVTSVAKGQTKKLTSEFSSSLKAEVSGDYFDLVSLGLSSTQTVKYSTSVTFSGPPESSAKSSREYRVKFYVHEGPFTQTKTSIFGTSTKSGTYIEPYRNIEYSVDR